MSLCEENISEFSTKCVTGSCVADDEVAPSTKTEDIEMHETPKDSESKSEDSEAPKQQPKVRFFCGEANARIRECLRRCIVRSAESNHPRSALCYRPPVDPVCEGDSAHQVRLSFPRD